MQPNLEHRAIPLKALKLPTSIYRQHRGDMIESYKVLHNVYDLAVVIPPLIHNKS